MNLDVTFDELYESVVSFSKKLLFYRLCLLYYSKLVFFQPQFSINPDFCTEKYMEKGPTVNFLRLWTFYYNVDMVAKLSSRWRVSKWRLKTEFFSINNIFSYF